MDNNDRHIAEGLQNMNLRHEQNNDVPQLNQNGNDDQDVRIDIEDPLQIANHVNNERNEGLPIEQNNEGVAPDVNVRVAGAGDFRQPVNQIAEFAQNNEQRELLQFHEPIQPPNPIGVDAVGQRNQLFVFDQNHPRVQQHREQRQENQRAEDLDVPANNNRSGVVPRAYQQGIPNNNDNQRGFRGNNPFVAQGINIRPPGDIAPRNIEFRGNGNNEAGGGFVGEGNQGRRANPFAAQGNNARPPGDIAPRNFEFRGNGNNGAGGGFAGEGDQGRRANPFAAQGNNARPPIGIVGNNQEAVDGFFGEENRDVVMPHFDQNQPANGLQQGNQQLGRRNNLPEREDFNQYGHFNEPVHRAYDAQNPAAPENPNNNFRQNNDRQNRYAPYVDMRRMSMNAKKMAMMIWSMADAAMYVPNRNPNHQRRNNNYHDGNDDNGSQFSS